MREMLRFHDGAGFVELALDEVLKGTPSDGDAKMTVKISSKGFLGENAFWVLGEDLQAFCRALRNLEQNRKGEASLRSMSPGEFHLKVFAIDSCGHIGIEGATSHRFYGGQGRQYLHSVTFGFDFDPSQLAAAANVEWIRRAAQ